MRAISGLVSLVLPTEHHDHAPPLWQSIDDGAETLSKLRGLEVVIGVGRCVRAARVGFERHIGRADDDALVTQIVERLIATCGKQVGPRPALWLPRVAALPQA